MNKQELEAMIREILAEETGSCPVKLRKLPEVRVAPADRLETGNPGDQVFTHDVFSLQDSPRLGAGIMEMTKTDFPWELNYDELDYVIRGELTIHCGDHSVTAREGELILIPKGSRIRFSATEFARFLYVTYPADWQGQ